MKNARPRRILGLRFQLYKKNPRPLLLLEIVDLDQRAASPPNTIAKALKSQETGTRIGSEVGCVRLTIAHIEQHPNHSGTSCRGIQQPRADGDTMKVMPPGTIPDYLTMAIDFLTA